MQANDVDKAIMNHKEMQRQIQSELESRTLRNKLGGEQPEISFSYKLNFFLQGYPLPLGHFQVMTIGISKPVSNQEKKRIEEGIRNVFKTIFQD